MFHFFTQTSQAVDEVPVCFHCPACHHRDVRGAAWTELLNTRILYVLPIAEDRVHWVKGPCCGRQLKSTVGPGALAQLDADTIEGRELLSDHVSFLALFLLACALVLSCVPVIGLVFLLLAWLGSSRVWFRMTWRAALLLHLIAMNALVFALVGSKK